MEDRSEAVELRAGGLQVVCRDSPRPGKGDVVLAPRCVGICGTDLEMLRGERPTTARILGHEGAAEVVEVGSGVEHFKPGAAVVFNPVDPEDPSEVLGHSYDGLFQRRFLATSRAVRCGLLLEVDAELPPRVACLAEPVATVVYGFELVAARARIDSVLIVGDGPIAAICAIVASVRGCSRICLAYAHGSRAEWLQQRGLIPEVQLVPFARCLSGDICPPVRHVDAVLVCVPRRSAVCAIGLAAACVARGGVVDLVGGVPEGAQVPGLEGVDLAEVRRSNASGNPPEGIAFDVCSPNSPGFWLTGHRGSSPEHLRQAVSLLWLHPTRFMRLFSHAIAFGALPDALSCLRRRERSFAGAHYFKGMVDFGLAGTACEIL